MNSQLQSSSIDLQENSIKDLTFTTACLLAFDEVSEIKSTIIPELNQLQKTKLYKHQTGDIK
mgnify:CR=1 FL=1